MKKIIILALVLLAKHGYSYPSPLINGRQINPMSEIRISTLTVTGSSGVVVTNSESVGGILSVGKSASIAGGFTVGVSTFVVSGGIVSVGHTASFAGVSASPAYMVTSSGPYQGQRVKTLQPLGAGVQFLDGNGQWDLRTSTDNSFNIDTYNGAALSTAVTVLQSGYVGMGTTAPSHPLEIINFYPGGEIAISTNVSNVGNGGSAATLG
jgi:hypothetical protein